jgi:hypothetical protein
MLQNNIMDILIVAFAQNNEFSLWIIHFVGAKSLVGVGDVIILPILSVRLCHSHITWNLIVQIIQMDMRPL